MAETRQQPTGGARRTAPLLGVNIDHVATLREARKTRYPDPLYAALIAEQAGADGITLHLREDRRHIQEHDVLVFKERLQTRMNLEMAPTDAMIAFAEKVRPEHICLVPERREELTTEGGLDVINNTQSIRKACTNLHDYGCEVSLFIDAEQDQIKAALDCGAKVIELHTGRYAEAGSTQTQAAELEQIQSMAHYATSQGLIVNAGHGLHYHNVEAIAAIEGINELNIGHGIIARAVFTGMFEAVREMKRLIARTVS